MTSSTHATAPFTHEHKSSAAAKLGVVLLWRGVLHQCTRLQLGAGSHNDSKWDTNSSRHGPSAASRSWWRNTKESLLQASVFMYIASPQQACAKIGSVSCTDVAFTCHLPLLTDQAHDDLLHQELRGVRRQLRHQQSTGSTAGYLNRSCVFSISASLKMGIMSKAVRFDAAGVWPTECRHAGSLRRFLSVIYAAEGVKVYRLPRDINRGLLNAPLPLNLSFHRNTHDDTFTILYMSVEQRHGHLVCAGAYGFVNEMLTSLCEVR